MVGDMGEEDIVGCGGKRCEIVDKMLGK